MATQKKLGDPTGVGGWKNLDSAGDVKRLLAWCIHSIRNNTLDPKTAAIIGQLSAFMLKAVEVADVERELERINQKLNAAHEHEATHGDTTH